MKEPTRDCASNISSRRAAAVLAFFALNLAVYLIRIVSVWRYGALFAPTAVESPTIDSVWRCIHHRPVYTDPFTFPFSLSLYNYLFYDMYAGVLRLIGAWDAGILTWGRQFTLVFALAGALAQWRLVRSLLKLRCTASALALALALGLWLSTSLVKYWALSIRPDMAAAALAMIALWVVVRQPRFAFAYAGVLLYLAWAFKQSVVLAFAGLCVYLVLHKKGRDLSILVAVFAVLVAATLCLGTPEYRFSILVAPRMVKGFAFGLPWILRALGAGLTALLLNLYWVAAPFLLLRASCLFNASAGERPTDSAASQSAVSEIAAPVRLLATVFAVALVAGLAGMGKVGGTSNYLFEAFAAGSTLLQIAVFTVPRKLVTALVLFACAQPALQLAGAAIGYHRPGKKDMAPIATAADYAQAVALRDRLATMPRPIFTTNGPLALPWNSTTNGAPALVIDPNFQAVAESRDQNGGIEGMLQRGEIPTVVLASTDLIYLSSLNPNYLEVAESLQQGTTYHIYQLNKKRASLFQFSESARKIIEEAK
ncbi:MAG: hypothetical protein ABSD44_05355 [Terracidiphilus sp.]